ncbi:MAG: ASKHA domain-containing protein [Clostridia bacterium]|nr:ASKHA domain-containing protein [Clostridia bacterium]
MPDNVTVELPEGALLSDGARLTGLFVEMPCGGKGTCGKCRVRIISEAAGNTDFSVLICQTIVGTEPMTVQLPSVANRLDGQFEQHPGDLAQYVPEGGGRLEIPESFLRNVNLKVAAPALLDGLSDADRFANALTNAVHCQAVDLPLDVLAVLPERIREAEAELRVSFYAENDKALVVDVSSGKAYGAAVDVGTTTIVLWLVDMADHKVVAARAAYNDQVECGSDVISRINYARKRLPELTARVLKTINGLLGDACAEAGIVSSGVRCLSVAGNTTMTHLLLGIAPEYIRLSPYTPAVFQPQIYRAGQLGITACGCAPVLFAPAIGSYVGGDITAGLLCTSLAMDADQTILFIDIGTNGELVLGNGEFIFACACSAGPAFEGGGMKHGVRASAGAIERVKIDPKTGTVEIQTIGGVSPTGICGSGVISMVAELFRNRLIDSAGKFVEHQKIIRRGKSAEYALCEGITISEADIGNFIRAKGAIFSACQTILESVGMTFLDVERIYVAGGFGRFLDLEDARTVGLFPRLPDEKFTFLGNASVIGAYLALVSEERRAKERDIAGRITYVDLSNEPGYMDQYMGAQFIPHTDMALFE